MSELPDFETPAELSPHPTAPGYEFLEVLAKGGMGAVYHGRDVQLGRDVAIKVLQPGGNQRRFVDEARIIAQLQHPGIPPVHEVGRLTDGRWFMVMKLIKGSSLAEVLREGTSPHDFRLLAVFEQVCQIVAYAHARRVIHRDLKPSNVMIGMFGEVLVMDWGLAHVLAEGEIPATPGPPNIVGTPVYIPPEQARGEVGDCRSDVFGLGGILCAVLTGAPPFDRMNGRDLLQCAAAGDLTAAFARLDACGAHPELIALAKRCLAPNREDRPADATEVAKTVTELRASLVEQARQPETPYEQPKQARTQLLILAFLVLAVLLLFANALALWSPR